MINVGDWIKVTDFDYTLPFNHEKDIDMVDIDKGVFKVKRIIFHENYLECDFKCSYINDIDITFLDGEIVKADLSDMWASFIDGRFYG